MANIIMKADVGEAVEILREGEDFEQSQQNFRYHAANRGENYAVSHVSVQETGKGEALLCLEREIARPYRSPEERFGVFGSIYRLETYTPEKFAASMHDILNQKVDITALSFDKRIASYAPETDIHSLNQKVYFEEQAARLLGDLGISVDAGFREDFNSLESVGVIPGQQDAIDTAHLLKEEYRELKREFDALEAAIERDLNLGRQGLDRISFRRLPTPEKLPLIPAAYQARYADLMGRLNGLWEIIYRAKREVVDENFQRMSIPEQVTANPAAVVERSMELTLARPESDPQAAEVAEIAVAHEY